MRDQNRPEVEPSVQDQTGEAVPVLWPATPLQQGLLALAEADPTAGVPDPYTGQAVLQVDGPLPAALLRRALEGLVADQPQLHAGFLLAEDVDPVQFLDPGLPLAHRVEVVADVADLEGAVERARTADRTRGWDLQDPPLVRWTHVTTAAGSTPTGRSALVVTAHHAVLDAWSMPLLAGEIARRLAELTGNPDADVPAPPVGRYADHLDWLSAQDVTAAAEFWRAHFAGTTDAPAVSPTRGRRTTARTTVRVRVGHRDLLARDGLTAADWARTCWGLALDAVTGRTGTPFAVPVSGRSPEVEGVQSAIGLFTDSVLVVDVADPAGTLAAVARAGADRWRASLPHHHVGLRGIFRALRSPELAGSLLSVDVPAGEHVWRVGPLTLRLRGVEDGTHYPLALTVRPDGADWELDLDHDPARVPDATARRVLHAVAAFLTADPTTPVTAVEVRDPADVDAVRTAGTGPRTGEPVPALLPVRYREVVTRCAADDLLVGAGPAGELARETGAQLDRAVTALRDDVLAVLPADPDPNSNPNPDPAHAGAGPHVVAVSLPRSHRTVHALLAVLTAGAAVLVLDPTLPPVRRDQVLREAGAVVLVGPGGVRALHARPRGARVRTAGPDDVAAVVLTSGSTGTPKAVAVPHRALAHLCARQLQDLHPATRVAVAHTAAFHFDAQWDALLALFGGHTVHVLAEDLYLDPFALAEHLRQHAIAYLDLTPTVWSALLSAGTFATLPAVCVVGGEAFGADLWTRLRSTGSRVLNLYGPTEATVDAFAADVADSPVPVVGNPVGATGALVLDEWLRRVPPGTEGELHLTGPQLAHGYLGRPALTAERFVANPFPRIGSDGRPLPGDERLYRTGDRAHWDADGLLVLSGRTDDQISLNGLRIEPGEVEHVLLTHPHVTRAVVLAPETGRGRRLVAWVVLRGGAPSPQELRDWCAQRAAAHLVPRDVVVLDDLPLTPNGKLDRTRLPLPAVVPSATTTPGGDVPALGDVLDALAGVLRLPAVGAGDDFFALGGDSISAVQVSARLRTLGWDVRTADVLVARTPEAVARTATPVAPLAQPSTPRDDLVALDPAVRADLAAHVRSTVAGSPALERVLPLTPTQLGILVDAARTIPDPYRTTATLRLDDPDGVLDRASVETAVAGWTRRHPALRTGFWQGPLPEPVAFVPDRLTPPFRVVAVGPGESPDRVLARVQGEELDRPVDPAAARLSGATWVRGTGPTSWLVVSLHHLLADGWSVPVLVEELRAELRGEVLQVPATDGFVEHLRAVAALDVTALERVWTTELAGARPTLLGGGRTARADRVVRRTATLPDGVAAGLRSRRATVATAVQAAWAAVLAARTGRTDVCWALTSAGRRADVAGSDRAVGMFITTRPVRAETDCTAEVLLREVMEATARTEDAAVLGLGRTERLVGRLADTLVVVENYPRSTPVGDGLEVTPVEGHDATTFPVTATAHPGPEFTLEVELDPDLLGETPGTDVAQELLDGWVRALLDLVAGRAPDLGTVVRRTAPVVPAVDPVSVDPAATTGTASGAGVRAARIAAVASEVLGGPVGVHDDFFAVGGDSISAVRWTGALRRHGIAVTIADVFAARTPAALDGRATEVVLALAAAPTEGPVPTPALAWLADLADTGADLRGFQQLRVVDLPPGCTAAAVARAATGLTARHEALRLRVRGPRIDVTPARSAVVVDVPGADLEPALARVVREIDHTTGDLLRWVVTDGGSPTPRLAVAAHHVAVDAVSWPVLLDELRLLLTGTDLSPAPSFTAWTHAQQRAVPAAGDHLAHWLRVLAPADPLVPEVPGDPSGLGTAGDAVTREVVLDPVRSRRFLDLVAAGWRPDALLAAALTADRTQDLVVELEGHGRPTALPADDPRSDPSSGALGWFTATWPVRVPAGRGRDPLAHLRSTARAVVSSAALGPDHGLLRHLDPVTAPQLRAAARATPPQVLLNWLGRETPALGAHDPWSTSLDAAALEDRLGLHRALPVSHAWELNAWATRTADGPAVVTRWQVAAPLAAHADDVLGAWSARLTDLLDGPDAGAAPTAVHDAVGLRPAELDALCSGAVAPQAVWPLTPVQRGMVFHAGDEQDRYTSSAGLRFGGDLDEDRVRAALAATVAAHPQLRTRIAHVGPTPVLVTDAHVDLAWGTAVEVPYDLERGPLLRARLTRTGPDEHLLEIGSHHVLLDGWSVPALVAELLGRCAGTWTAPDEDLVRGPHARHVARRSALDPAAALRRWEDLLVPLRDAGHLTPLLPAPTGAAGAVLRAETEVPSAVLARAAAVGGGTPASAVAAAWSIVLGAACGRSAVSTGTVVSGRDEASEPLLGMLIDTVPLVADLTGTVADLVAGLAEQTARAGAEPLVGLAALTTRLGCAPWTDTLLVVENYPAGAAQEQAAAAGLDLRETTGEDGTHHALSLTAETGGERAVLRLEHDPDLLDAAGADTVLGAVRDVLHGLADATPSTPLDRIAGDLDPAVAALGAGWRTPRPTVVSGPVPLVQEGFAAVLGTAVGPDDDFFALGGDSILAMRLITHLRAAGWVLRPSAVVAAPTPARLAALAEPVADAPAAAPAPSALLDLDPRGSAALDALLRNLR